jgi:hypothetical protein
MPSGVRVTSFFSKGAPARNSSAALRQSAGVDAGNSAKSAGVAVVVLMEKIVNR